MARIMNASSANPAWKRTRHLGAQSVGHAHMYANIPICVCIYIYIHTCTHTHGQICIYINVYVHVCMYTHVQMYVFTYVNTCLDICIVYTSYGKHSMHVRLNGHGGASLKKCQVWGPHFFHVCPILQARTEQLACEPSLLGGSVIRQF